jgi:hypothetical protein
MQLPPESSLPAASGQVRHDFIQVMEAIVDHELDLAQYRFERLVEGVQVERDNPGLLFLSTVIAIQRGRAREALQALVTLGEDVCPELRVLCLYSIQDPLWEGLARSVREVGTPGARAAMGIMLDRYQAVVQASTHPVLAAANKPH